MVVIAIIGILASIVLVSLTGSREKANIAKVLQFNQSVEHALGAYAVGVWRFEDNVNDASGYDNHGTIIGDPQYVANSVSSLGKALDFDGAGDAVEILDDPTLRGMDNATWTWWYNADTLPQNAKFIKYGGWNYIFGLLAGGRYGFEIWNEDGTKILNWQPASPLPRTGEWMHCAVTYNSDDCEIKIYIDSNFIDSITVAPADCKAIRSLSNTSLFIGAYGVGIQNFNGIIDEVKIYDVALSVGQIQKHYVEGLGRRGKLTLQGLEL